MKCSCKLLLLTIAANLVLSELWAENEDDFLKPAGKPTKIQARHGSDAMALLPLPAPRPTQKQTLSSGVLIGKVIWGGYRDYQWTDGQKVRVLDWNMIPDDGQQLLSHLKYFTGMDYKVQTVDLASFSGDPAEIPVLLFSGCRALRITAADRLKLRKYLMDGGMIWFDSIVGSPYFYNSALKEMAAILPDSPIVKIPSDHPVLRMVKPVGKVGTNKGELPYADLDGVYLGSRLATVISPYGLGCGLDDAYPELVAQAKYYQRNAAITIATNLAAYAIGWFEVGKIYARPVVYHERNVDDDQGKVFLAQVRFRGLWNTDPGSEAGFMRFLGKSLNMDTVLTPVIVDLSAATATDDYPFLYLSGMGDFKLSKMEADRLRQYLSKGGCLLVNNSLGLSNFDAAFRRELANILPDATLELIPAGHQILAKGPYRFSGNGFTAPAAEKFPGCKYPLLYGVKDGDRYCIIYSPVDLGGGWTGAFKPGSCAYEPEVAAKLGADIVTYFIAH